VTAIMLFMVPLTVLMIFIYSTGYSNFQKPRDARDEPGYPPHNGASRSIRGSSAFCRCLRPAC